MPNRYDTSHIFKISNRSVFFDANVLIYLFGASGSKFQSIYAQILAELLKQKNKLVVNFMVISEIINRMTRLEYDKYKQENGLSCGFSYKQYRDSSDGKVALFETYQIVNNKIIKQFDIVGKIFSRSDIQDFFEINHLDFNDKAIVNVCQEFNLVLLTHDGDFACADLDILTANNKLLRLI